jgi:hypothetical protein
MYLTSFTISILEKERGATPEQTHSLKEPLTNNNGLI